MPPLTIYQERKMILLELVIFNNNRQIINSNKMNMENKISKLVKETSLRQGLGTGENQSHRCFFVQKISTCRLLQGRTFNSWKMEERIKYLAFVNYYSREMREVERKDLWCFFRALSHFVLTRNPNQCRIYHKKMVEKFQNTQEMLRMIQIQVPEFQRIVKVYDQQLSNLLKKIAEEPAPRKIADEQVTQKQVFQLELKKMIEKDFEGNFLVNPIIRLGSMNGGDLKEDKIENIRTDVSIRTEEVSQRQARPSIDCSLFNTQPLPYHPNRNPVTHPMPLVPSFWPGYYGHGYPSFQSQKEERNQREWQECHSMYMNWTSKLRSLMAREQ